jgi:hypothetical protein
MKETNENSVQQSLVLVNPAVLLAGFEKILEKYFPKENPKKIWTRNEIARKLGKSHHWVTKQIKQGLLRSFDGKNIMEEALQEYIKNKSH